MDLDEKNMNSRRKAAEQWTNFEKENKSCIKRKYKNVTF
jgi:hypothetical protein